VGAPIEPALSKLQQLKQTLAARGLAPQKTFGQNFMVDTNFATAIARDARIDDKTLVIEVGPGTGCLTRALLDAHAGSRVLAIEIDRGLAALLRESFADVIASGKLTLLEGDVLAGKHELSPQFVEAVRSISAASNRPRRILCANLPYNAATPLLANLAIDNESVEVAEAVVTIQLEMAERLLANAGEAEYGALSALIALRAERQIIRRVGSEVFWPRPKVSSAVVRLAFKPWGGAGGLRKDEAPAFQEFLQKIFSQRRKTIRAVLRPAVLPETLDIDPRARAEDIAPETLLEMFRHMQPGHSSR
jgi:16S rRNA (adenine1518-N6/adenine1519-N6)-dimethyltransferase